VPVLITSCHVSEKWNIGPVTAHRIMMIKATINAIGLPVTFVMVVEKRSNNFPMPF
jgi:hypothetical protein